MAWQLKSDKTGKLYDFADDVEPADALKYLDGVLEKDATAGQVAGAVGQSFMKGLGSSFRGAFGAPQMEFDESGKMKREIPSRTDFLNTGDKQDEGRVQDALGGATPGFWGKAGITAAESLGSNILPIATGGGMVTSALKAGAPVGQAITSGLQGTLVGASAQEGEREFRAQRQAGEDFMPAALAASFSGLSEYVGERMAFSPLKSLMSQGGATGKVLFEYLLKDQAGEQVTTAMQWLNRKMTREPNATLSDLAEEAKLTAASTLIGGPAQAAVNVPVMRGAVALGTPAQPAPPRVEPTGTIPGTPEAPPVPPEEPKGKTRLVRDEDLPLVGQEQPDDGKADSRELPPDMQLELLRGAWERFNTKSFQDSAEDRIARRGEFLQRRQEFEQALQFNPEARALLRESDSVLGITAPTIETNLEQEVDEWAVLTPEEVQQRKVAREEELLRTDANTSIPYEIRQALGITDYGAGVDYPVLETSINATEAVREDIEAKTVLLSSRPELDGLASDQMLAQLQPDDVVYVGQPGQVNVSGAPWFMEMLQDLKRTYLPDRALVIGQAPGEKSSFYSRAYPVQPGVLAMALPNPFAGYANPTSLTQAGTLPVNRSTIDVLDTVLHEFTHLVHMRHWDGSTAAEKAAVAKEYHEDLRFIAGDMVKGVPAATVEAGLNRLYSPKTAARMLQDYVDAGGQADDSIMSARAKKNLVMFRQRTTPSGVEAGQNYWFNFSEWMAHKGVKYFTTRLGVRQENAGFFKRMVVGMRQFYSNFVAKYVQSPPAFSEWMDNIAARESGLEGVMTAAEVEGHVQDLVADGMDADLARVFVAAKGTDRGLIQKIKKDQRTVADGVRIAEAEERQFTVLGEALKITTRKALVEKLKGFRIVQDLSKMAPFDNYRRFDAKQFMDAVLSTVFTSKNITREDTGGKSFWVFEGQMGEAIVEYNPQTGLVKNMNSHYAGTADDLVQAGVLGYVLRELAQAGVSTVSVSEQLSHFSPEVLRHFDVQFLGNDKGVLTIPHYSFQPPARPGKVEPPEMRIPTGLVALGRTLNLPGMPQTAAQLGRFNAFFSKALGAYQLIKLNSHIPGMEQEKTALRNRMAYRHKWLTAANETVERWNFKLPKTEAAKLSRVLFEEAESGAWMSTQHPAPNNPGHYVFIMNPKEVAARGLSQETQELYSQVRNDFMRFADEWQKVGMWETARAELSDVAHLAVAEAMRRDGTLQDIQQIIDGALQSIGDPNKVKRVRDTLKDLQEQFDAWKAKPYMPFTRFGRFGVLVRDAADTNTKYFESFETQIEAQEAAQGLKGRFAGDAVSVTYLEDVPYMLAGLPPAMLQAMKKTLNLTQAQQDEFSQILLKLSHANSFAHRQARKAGVEGYSTDALRAYSDYFRRGASYLARIKSEPELNDALGMLKGYISAQTKQAGDVNQVANLGRLHEWFERLHKYLNDPGSEYGEVKSLMSLWFFGFNVSSAVMNVTQVPFVTLPWMSERFGTTQSVKLLGKAYADVLKMYTKQATLKADETAMLDFAREAGFRDESQATVLAQISDGSALARVGANSRVGKYAANFNHYAMWMFGKAELLNRDVTLITAYRAKRKGQYNGAFDRDAFDFARQTVEETHNEYSMENRPELMRGGGSVVFQFMHYVQNMLFMQLGGDASWWRLLAVQLFIGGMMGLPFAENLIDLGKFIGRRFDKDFDIERETRIYVKELGANPDLFMRGVMSNVWGADLSRRISLGDVVPGMKSLGSNRKFEDVMYGAVGDVGGAGASLLMNAMKFVAENDKTTWDAWKGIMPSAVRNLGNATKAFTSGKATDRSGATIFEPDTWDLLQMSTGFQPRELGAEYNARTLEQEKAAYWTTRRRALLEMWKHLMLDRGGDREATRDFLDRLEEFNKAAPDAKLKLTGETLRQSLKAAVLSRTRKEAGLGTNPSMVESTMQIRQTFERE